MKQTTWVRWMELGGHICHQRPERSFFVGGYQMPVCARCAGVFLGYLLFALTYWFWKPPLYAGLICFGVMGLDWGLQQSGILLSTNIRRLITGALGGYGFLVIVFHALYLGVRLFE